MAQLCTDAQGAKEKEAEATTEATKDDFASLAAFPPKFRDIACKPLLFDLAS